jgi:hypothetical protein
MRITLSLITFITFITFVSSIFGILIYLYTITPRYDISHVPPINGYCIGDQIVDHRECINPTCLDGYNLDYGSCVESKPYSNLAPYSDVIYITLFVGGLLWVSFLPLLLFWALIQCDDILFDIDADTEKQEGRTSQCEDILCVIDDITENKEKLPVYSS